MTRMAHGVVGVSSDAYKCLFNSPKTIQMRIPFSTCMLRQGIDEKTSYFAVPILNLMHSSCWAVQATRNSTQSSRALP